LPAAVLLPAIGLEWIWQWPRLPKRVGGLLAGALVAGSLLWTINDYRAYARHPELEMAFEAAATELAQDLRSSADEAGVYLDDRLWTSWPSLPFLVTNDERIFRYTSADDLPGVVRAPSAIFAWPYDSLDFVPALLDPPVQVRAVDGPLTRGDLEEAAYPLYVKYDISLMSAAGGDREANFGDQIYLKTAEISRPDANTLQLDIYWEADGAVSDDLVAFTHVEGPEGLIGQIDRPIAGGRWPGAWWRPGLQLHDVHTVALDEPFDSEKHQVSLGLYEAGSGERLPVYDAGSGQLLGTTWVLGQR
jgi:hypothetical protein